jgi:hypothetical protein
MTQVSIHGFDGVGFFFIIAHLIRCTIIERVIDRKGITVILFGLRSPLQASLQVLTGSFFHHIPTEKAVCGSIYDRRDVDCVFFCFRKV